MQEPAEKNEETERQGKDQLQGLRRATGAVLISKLLYLAVVFLIPAAAFFPRPDLPLHVFVLWLSFPLHMAGFIAAYLKPTPYGWVRRADGLHPDLALSPDKRQESIVAYDRRVRRQIGGALAILEFPSLLALLAVASGLPKGAMIYVIAIGATLSAAILPRIGWFGRTLEEMRAESDGKASGSS